MLNLKLISIDIGSQNIKVVVGSKHSNGIKAEKLYSIPTPVACFEDGMITDTNKMKDALLSIPEISEGRIKNAVATSKSNSIISREIVVPKAEGKELDSVVKYELEKYLPINMEEYVMQYVLINSIVEENVNKLKLRVVAYPKNIIEGYFKVFKALKLKPRALDINSNSIMKLISSKNKLIINDENYNSGENVIFIDFGHDNSNLLFTSDRKFEFNRVIPYGGKFINMNIKKGLLVSMEQAEELKLKMDELGGTSAFSREMVQKCIEEALRIWCSEVERIVEFYRTKNTGIKIDKIYLYGGGANTAGIEDFMTTALNIPVYKLGSLNNAELPQEEEKNMGLYLNAVGAVVRL